VTRGPEGRRRSGRSSAAAAPHAVSAPHAEATLHAEAASHTEDAPYALCDDPRPIDRDELARPSPEVAHLLLGRLLVRSEADGTEVIARIVETEAYRQDDPASHSHRGRTPRTIPMFAAPGTAYVYRSYGVHWCCNVTAEPDGIGAAVLLRAAAVLAGHDHVRPRRPAARRDRDLLRGPGRLTAGLDLDGPRHDGGDLVAGVAGLRLADDGWRPPAGAVETTPRVGVRLAAGRPWRFHLAGEPAVSPYRRHPRAERPD
jgi:DNA-3-methyladenine glycosylase